MVGDLIGALYDGIGNLEAMPTVIEKIAREFSARGSQFGVVDRNGHWSQSSSVGIDPAGIQDYLDHYAATDPRMPFCLKHPGQIFACYQMVTDQGAYERSALVNDLLLHVDSRFSMNTLIPAGDGHLVAFCLMRGVKDGRFEERDVQRIAPLLPHIQRAMALHIRLGRLEDSLASLQSLVDHLDSPVLLIDNTGALCHANQSGLDGIGQGTFLVLNNGRVEPRNQQLKHAFADILRGVAHETPDVAPAYRNNSLRLTDREGHVAVLTLEHLRGTRNLAGLPRASIAVFLKYCAARPRPSPGQLQALFQFTPAEARLAQGLMQGRRLEQITEDFNLTKETLKTQLRWIFQKTGTHSQSQLVAALCAACTVGFM